MRYQYILYDARARTLPTGDCTVLCAANSLKEARQDKREMFPDAVIYRYEDRKGKLVKEEFVE